MGRETHKTNITACTYNTRTNARTQEQSSGKRTLHTLVNHSSLTHTLATGTHKDMTHRRECQAEHQQPGDFNALVETNPL